MKFVVTDEVKVQTEVVPPRGERREEFPILELLLKLFEELLQIFK